MKKVGLLIIGLLVVGICLCAVLMLSNPRNDVERKQPTEEVAAPESTGMTYDECVTGCVNTAREANIDRNDITDADYQIIMAEHKNYICPGRCEKYK